MIEIRVPTEDDWPALCHVDARGFGFSYTEQEIVERRPIMDLSRFRIACDGGEIVGIVGSFQLDVTVPGGRTLPMGGVTWVSAAATHRRQGIVTRLMAAAHDDIRARGEPLANLTASESGIYERFGYGVANHIRTAAITTGRVHIREEHRPKPGAVRFMSDDDAREVVPELWERYRRTRAGEVSRSAEWHEMVRVMRSRPEDGASATWYLRHTDGYVSYRVTDHWNDGWPRHELDVLDFVAVTPDAHAALWHTLLGVDLVGLIKVRRLPEDDPLPYLVNEYRAVRTTALNDGLWVNVFDAPACFAARTYPIEDRFVVETTDHSGATARVAIEGGPAGATARAVRTRPDLTMTTAALGALLYGGIRPSSLAAGRRLTARNDDVLRRADVFFPSAPAPFCQTPY